MMLILCFIFLGYSLIPIGGAAECHSSDCSGNGCLVDNICECDDFYTGIVCNISGAECHSSECSGNGCLVDNICECDGFYTGIVCNISCLFGKPNSCPIQYEECSVLNNTLVCSCENAENSTCTFGQCQDEYLFCEQGFCYNRWRRFGYPILKCFCNNGYTGIRCDEEIGSTTDQVIQTSTLIALPSEEPISANDPYITNARPNYGPKAGGTTLTLHGHNLLLVSSVNLGDDMVCYTRYRNDTLLKVVTPKLRFNQTGFIGESLPIKLVNNSTVKFDLSHVFVYKENPKIKTVFPLETIRKGGTKLTVLGSNFDSVSVITMVTTMLLKRLVDKQARVYNETRKIYTTMCSFINSTQLICFTPKFELLPEIVFESSRKKRDIPRNEDDNALPIAKFQKGAMPMQQSDTLKTVLKAELRARRSTKIEFSNGGDLLEFHIGFNLDGVNEYKNYSKIDVYIEPQFHLDQRVWKYSKSKPIHFQGEHLDVGLTVYDYRITVGSEPCHQLELLSNELSCYPPVVKPELQNENHMEHPRIKIHVGLHITHTAGYLNYQDDTLPLYVIILAAVIPACVVIMSVVLVIVCVKKRQKIG